MQTSPRAREGNRTTNANAIVGLMATVKSATSTTAKLTIPIEPEARIKKWNMDGRGSDVLAAMLHR